MNGPYEFKESDAEEFARSRGDKTFRKGKEMFFKWCPYCNGGGKDQNTFSINLDTGVYNCFRSSCGANGNMLTLARDFDFSLGHNIDEYYRPKRHYKVFKQPEAPIEPKEAAIAYMESRGIPLEIIQKYEITSKDDGVIAFPFRDEKNQIVMIKYRNPAPKEGQNKEWFESDCKPILFGMNHCNPENGTLIVTEGQIDSLSVAAAGFKNAVSVPGGVRNFRWIPYCWNWISQFKRIIIFGDHENGKVTLHADFQMHWKNKVWCVRPEDYMDCKDANDILRKYGADQIKHCIENAEQPKITNVMALDEVEEVDISSLEKLRTGLPTLDETLLGGLPFGQVILITGKSGDGKSTFANQMIVNAIDQGYKVFVYSGELPNYLLRAWIDFQAAGPDNVELVRRYGRNTGTYHVKPEAKAKISEWYKDVAWMYDNRIATTEEVEQFKLIDLLEEVIEQNGVRVILLDNMMTAMDLEPEASSSDKYEKQSKFMKKLARIAMKHDALIILVAHKRKMDSKEANDTVSGSSDIVNLASIVISYERGRKEDGDDIRWLKVTKNRLFGVTHRGIKLTFDNSSKRIYQTIMEPKWHYGWEEFGEPEEQMELPWDEMGVKK